MARWNRRRQWSITGLGLIQAIVALVCLVGMFGRSSAQFFDDRFPMFERRFFEPARPAAPAPPPDNSKAPAPRKNDRSETANPANTVLVLGDSMADWLGYGLELAYQDSPDMAVTRRVRTWSSLIYNDAKRELRNKNNVDWPQFAKEILAAEQPKFIVMMIGLSDRQPIRERPKAPEAKPNDKPADGKAADKSKDGAKDGAKDAAKDQSKDQSKDQTKDADAAKKQAIVDDELPPEPAQVVEEKKGPAGAYDFRTDKWADLYAKRIDEMIAVLKSKGVPVIWVGLPPIKGTKSTTEMSYLDDLFRSRAEKAGIAYVDVWDGFVDDGGRFAVQGPDVEGQYRRLRSADGVHFTSYGARKLAHYVDREIQRLLTPTGPIAISIPVEPEQKPAVGQPGSGTPRPLAGPVIPLNAINTASDEDQLLGNSAPRQSIKDALASQVLVKGETQAVPAGRADDFIWPRRAPAPVGADPVVATTTLPMIPMLAERAAPKNQQVAQAAAPEKPAVHRPRPQRQAPQPQVAQRAEPRMSNPFFFFFGR
jgi:hypothetical protein